MNQDQELREQKVLLYKQLKRTISSLESRYEYIISLVEITTTMHFAKLPRLHIDADGMWLGICLSSRNGEDGDIYKREI